MNASKIKSVTLKQLRAVRKSIMSARWILALEKKDAATRNLAANQMLRVQQIILKLESEQHAKIRDKLLETEAALVAGVAKLDSALANLNQVKVVLKAVDNFLMIVAQIVSIGEDQRRLGVHPPTSGMLRRPEESPVKKAISEKRQKKSDMPRMKKSKDRPGGAGEIEDSRASIIYPGRKKMSLMEEGSSDSDGGPEEMYFKDNKKEVKETARAAIDKRPTEEPLVNTGFARFKQPDKSYDARRPLVQQTRYYFWLEIGERVPGAIDSQTVRFKVSDLPKKAKLTVALFAFEGEFVITPGRDVGELEVVGIRKVRVSKEVEKPKYLKDSSLLKRRLFFQVTTPATTGRYRLRCNIYFQQVLLQSHLVGMEVGTCEKISLSNRKVLKTELDYKLSESLRADHLQDIPAHRLSVMLNDNGDGSHAFRFFGSDDKILVKNDVMISELTLKTRIKNVRNSLREVAWGEKVEWKNHRYRYEKDDPDLSRLKEDLLRLARRGRRLYVGLVEKLVSAEGDTRADRRMKSFKLSELMQKTGRVQIVCKDGPLNIVPAALLYDHTFPSDEKIDPKKVDLCPTFLESLESNDSKLNDCACFKGDCPSKDDKYRVCPSGFWGYRHAIGFPSSDRAGKGATFKLRYRQEPSMVVAVSTDFKLGSHLKKLQGFVEQGHLLYADNQKQTMVQMEKELSQLIYFYCHGGQAKDGTPYLEVGPRNAPAKITRTTLFDEKILWQKNPPLIFLNGCHTTALDPEKVMDLVTGFRECNAAGIIGTEITIFESLARCFAEEFLEHFFSGEEVGEAIRLARLWVLKKQKNPLGLVYIPFVLSSISLVKQNSSVK